MNRELENLLSSCDCSGPAEPEAIEQAEGELGIRFPDSYRDFLGRFGAVVGPGFRLAGVVSQPNDPPYWDDLVSDTRQLRSSSIVQIPHEYLPITDDGGDYQFYLDTSRFEGGECPVLVLGPGRDGIDVADSFDDFALLWIKHELQY